MQTTVATTAEEVHAFGLADLESIEAEKDEIAHRLGHADRHALREALADDPANHTDDPEALVRLAMEQTDRAYAAAPQYFGRLPSANCVVKAVEPYREAESPPAFYMPPSVDGSRPGQYYLNTYQPEQRQLHKIASITFHEATPGHHFQLAIEMELTGLPAFRTLGSRMAGAAYAEGWGLYCERLAEEMGLYASDEERLGMLDAQSFRAARLVVDSGLHAMNWTRDQAIEFMHERGSLPPVDAEIEVDRYTIWPGQALAYKIGQREIEARGARCPRWETDSTCAPSTTRCSATARCRWRRSGARSRAGSRPPSVAAPDSHLTSPSTRWASGAAAQQPRIRQTTRSTRS